MKILHVLIIDSEVQSRKLITETLQEIQNIRVLGSAANQQIALAKIAQGNPDVVLLDIELDGVGSLETLLQIRALHPALPILILNKANRDNLPLAMETIGLGAHDVIYKPLNPRGENAATELRKNLLPKLLSLLPKEEVPAVAVPVIKDQSAKKELKPAIARNGVPVSFAKGKTASAATDGRIDILAIGVSTGGPNALAELLPKLPADFPVPIVIVQHMPKIFTKLLADRLSLKTTMPVKEGFDGAELEPGVIWIAPGDFHMTIKRVKARVVLALNQDPPINSCRPAVDVLFDSVANVYGHHALGVVLTGMGNDGLRGCENLRAGGGRILVQDEESSVVWGMPGFVARAGLADKKLPLLPLALEIVSLAALGRPEFSKQKRKTILAN